MDKKTEDELMRFQKEEFDAVVKLCRAYNNLPLIVDDDYPEMRHYYEREVRNIISAFKANGRIRI